LKNSDISGVACESKYFLQTAGMDRVKPVFRNLANIDLKEVSQWENLECKWMFELSNLDMDTQSSVH
jgi:hypothetical protein